MEFEDLEVWKRAARLGADLFKATRALKDWGFRDQLTRAGLSISSNIAEGYERNSHRDCARFLSIAKGSCGEVRSQLYIGQDIGYIEADQANTWIQECKEISRMLAALIKRRTAYANEVSEEPLPYSTADQH
jgi:four helix bundle protein